MRKTVRRERQSSIDVEYIMKKLPVKYQRDESIPVDTAALECPVCNSLHMHQGAVEVFARKQEDDPSESFVVDGLTIKHGSGYHNPSGRRNGLYINFECEECHLYEDSHYRGFPFKLAIYQHKGITYSEWHIPDFDFKIP